MYLADRALSSSPPVVLVVEDEPPIVELLQDLLTSAGYLVECATTGLAGLARFRAGRVDLVLLDVDLPDLSGLELCRAVRAAGGAADGYVPIIMVTGMVSATACGAGFAAGADDYVLKPFDLQELLARVAVWLRVRRQVQAAQATREAPREGVRDQPAAPAAVPHQGVDEMAARLRNLLFASAFFLDLLEEAMLKPTARQRCLLGDARRGLDSAAYTVEQLQQVAVAGAIPSPAAQALDRARSAGWENPVSPPTVVLVEDDPSVSQLLADRLTSDGYVVLHARDGLEGIYTLDECLLGSDRRCIVLLDLMLPEEDGFGVLKHLRGGAAHVPVVAMSASATHLADAWAAGADALVPKPVDLDRLVEVVARYWPAGPNDGSERSGRWRTA